MKKKKSTSKSNPTNTANLDLKTLIHNHSLFFDKLIDLIPPKFYLPTDEDNKPWYQGLSKSAKAFAKKTSKENIKKSRRNRLDPEKASETTLDLLNQKLESEKPEKSEPKSDEETNVKIDGDDRSLTYEELRIRLRNRISDLRGNRGESSEFRERVDKRREFKRGKRMQNNKKSDDKTLESGKLRGDEESGKKNKKRKISSENSPENVNKSEKDVAEASKKLEFGKLRIGGDEEGGKTKKRKVSKAKELENAEKLVEAMKDPEKGEVVAKKHSWKAAVSRAAGTKVHDNPKLLKESMKKEKRKHEKNAEKWKERVETTQKLKAGKQETRSTNIADRIEQKKMRKIEKREKKLMRPGFEGRKEGFINAKD